MTVIFDEVEDMDEPEVELPPIESLAVTGKCDFCGHTIKGKSRRFCDVECMQEFNYLKAQESFIQ